LALLLAFELMSAPPTVAAAIQDISTLQFQVLFGRDQQRFEAL
jgi:hypothetical protein